MVEIKDRFGAVIHRGKNLRILSDYIYRVERRGRPIGVGLHRNQDRSGRLYISFHDGSFCETSFASFDVMCGWVWRKRKRSLDGVQINFYDENGKGLPYREIKLCLIRAGIAARIE